MTDRVSTQECRAIRALDRDDDYTRAEIAFMFATGEGTVGRHADRECQHNRLELDPDDRPDPRQEWTDGQLLNAFRIVYDRQSYCRMSPTVYDDHAPEDFPGARTIADRFGGWPAARKEARAD